MATEWQSDLTHPDWQLQALARDLFFFFPFSFSWFFFFFVTFEDFSTAGFCCVGADGILSLQKDYVG